MKKINKMLNLGLALIILGSILLNFNRTTINVCSTIDKLNEIYYNLYE